MYPNSQYLWSIKEPLFRGYNLILCGLAAVTGSKQRRKCIPVIFSAPISRSTNFASDQFRVPSSESPVSRRHVWPVSRCVCWPNSGRNTNVPRRCPLKNSNEHSSSYFRSSTLTEWGRPRRSFVSLSPVSELGRTANTTTKHQMTTGSVSVL